MKKFAKPLAEATGDPEKWIIAEPRNGGPYWVFPPIGKRPPSNDMVKLSKIMELTRPDRPGERDAAILKANQLLNQLGVTWTEFIIND
uniref:Uncharacterized protein n=1 Tax=Acidicaldus sp. TaxID=1872105 RepID=A0A8J4HAB4_9PROT